MTDANLMDAECIHGNVWYDCHECEKETQEYFGSLHETIDFSKTADEMKEE